MRPPRPILVACFISALLSLIAAQDYCFSSPAALGEDDFRILGLSLEMPINQALSRVGKPQMITKGGKMDEMSYYYQYNGYKLGSIDEVLGYIGVEKPNIKTKRGIGIGSHICLVKQAYPSVDMAEFGNGYYYELRRDALYNYMLVFHEQKGKVRAFSAYLAGNY